MVRGSDSLATLLAIVVERGCTAHNKIVFEVAESDARGEAFEFRVE